MNYSLRALIYSNRAVAVQTEATIPSAIKSSHIPRLCLGVEERRERGNKESLVSSRGGRTRSVKFYFFYATSPKNAVN